MKTNHLPLPARNSYDAEWIATPGNAVAYEAMKRWCHGQEPSQLTLVGPCSKSFLAQIASRTSGALLTQGQLPSLVNTAVVLDDADRITDSVAFFNWYNDVKSRHVSVLYTASTPPNAWPHQLPDLLSRLRTLPVVYIEPLTDDELEILLPRMLRTQGLDITESTVRFALKRMERSFGALRRLVDYAHQNAPHRRITKKFLSILFNQSP